MSGVLEQRNTHLLVLLLSEMLIFSKLLGLEKWG